ncbi:hypothetical protein Y032_0258g439 [Ancylostoma ceylanicum]|uniref:Peptidase A1 domain-containing protein n=1 Tax=Ancylostoma ceylanicum TaxID=53326 RepID=A0A016SBP1_9BILA|nr:hypothetical protein Y032_0258g439 [Ancylostoma ceylanicum]
MLMMSIRISAARLASGLKYIKILLCKLIIKVNANLGAESVCDISIGTPGKKFKVKLDLTTTDFWVPDYTCAASIKEICDLSKCDHGQICDIFCPDKSCCESNPMPRRLNACRGKSYFDQKTSGTYVETNQRFNKVTK